MLVYLILYRFRFCLRTGAVLKALSMVRLGAELIIMLMRHPKNNGTIIMISQHEHQIAGSRGRRT